PALAVGGAMWATIYSTVGLIGFKALAAGYQAAPGLTVGLAVCFALAVVGLVIGLKKPHETSEAAAESETSIGPGAESRRSWSRPGADHARRSPLPGLNPLAPERARR